MLALGIGSDQPSATGVGACRSLCGLVELGPCCLCFIGLEEGAGGYGDRATLKLVEQAHAVIEKLKCLVDLIHGDLSEPVIGQEEIILSVAEWVHEQDAQVAALRKNAQYAGGEDPYKAPRVIEE